MRLIISSLAIVSVLFISMSVSVEADDRAQELVRQARAAIGGEQALGAVRSLSVVGKLRRDDRSGEIKLDFLLPDKFKKTETITLIADIETTFTGTINGDQAWNDSSTNNSGGGSVRVNSRSVQPAEGAQAARGQQLRFEYARQLIALFLTSNSAFPVEFTYAGEAQSKDGRADMLDAKGPDGFQVRLFLDKATHRPLMMKYRGMIPRAVVNTQT
ncbi:MAG TPA: hypothetical protein VLR90_01415, partial [Blastocatellia bacterium]|nr:hypothetical protein [Blastocatellia bacterium]